MTRRYPYRRVTEFVDTRKGIELCDRLYSCDLHCSCMHLLPATLHAFHVFISRLFAY